MATIAESPATAAPRVLGPFKNEPFTDFTNGENETAVVTGASKACIVSGILTHRVLQT